MSVLTFVRVLKQFDCLIGLVSSRVPENKWICDEADIRNTFKFIDKTAVFRYTIPNSFTRGSHIFYLIESIRFSIAPPS